MTMPTSEEYYINSTLQIHTYAHSVLTVYTQRTYCVHTDDIYNTHTCTHTHRHTHDTGAIHWTQVL